MDSNSNYLDLYLSVQYSPEDWVDMPRPADPSVVQKTYKSRTIGLSEGDLKVLGYIQVTLGCSLSEAVRSSVRAFAGQLAQIERKMEEER